MSTELTIDRIIPSSRLNEILSPEESLAKLKEETTDFRQKRLTHPDQNILNNHDMAVGEALEPREFIRKLRIANPELIVEQGGIHNATAVRVRELDSDPDSPNHGKYVKRYLAGFYHDRILPEFSSFVNDKD